MSIPAISQIDVAAAMQEAVPVDAVSASSGFSDTLISEFNAVNDKLVGAEQSLQALAAGKETNLHHVMLNLEGAQLSFQLLMQVRNKVLDAYQEVMRTQI